MSQDFLPWLLLIISLPGRPGSSRMRIWRALKAVGAAALRDGVYLLPCTPPGRVSLEGIAGEVVEAGGSSHLFEFREPRRDVDKGLRGYFDRTEAYRQVIDAIQSVRATLPTMQRTEAERAIRQIRRRFEATLRTDFFPAAAHTQAAGLLDDIEQKVRAQFGSDEPRPARGAIVPRDIRDFRGRRWATRARPWIDRLASAWLIRRFIDREATFLWMERIDRCPDDAVGFDFDQAEFTHIGAQVSFEVLMHSFALEEDAALRRVAALVHYLDVGGVPVPEASGVELVLRGAYERYSDDDRLLHEAEQVFDSLYAAYQQALDDGE